MTFQLEVLICISPYHQRCISMQRVIVLHNPVDILQSVPSLTQTFLFVPTLKLYTIIIT